MILDDSIDILGAAMAILSCCRHSSVTADDADASIHHTVNHTSFGVVFCYFSVFVSYCCYKCLVLMTRFIYYIVAAAGILKIAS